uniref:cytochrome c oxidase subunit II n=1 Tax=Haltichella nipponensis TaxID=2907788 RepID=UPI001EDE86A9|nr:cytochrome c oxidase subunit II [Haltichella nipponensis]UIB40558.1 cytochrome c oxidase subunit II [Haltichella nipponensis]
MTIWGQMFFQDANSSMMENLINFHDHVMMIISMIIMLVMYFMIFNFKNKFMNQYLLSGQMIEIIWTMVPMLFLLVIAFPSLKILYMLDEIYSPMLSFKIIGHQWYWSYECNEIKMEFDSFMNNDFFRLLDVDNRLIIPYNTQMRLLISSLDVIHSFTVPSLGIKVDAVPGRLNQISLNIIRPGIYYGQCSEICGVNHSFMPVVMEVVNLKNFMKFYLKFK